MAIKNAGGAADSLYRVNGGGPGARPVAGRGRQAEPLTKQGKFLPVETLPRKASTLPTVRSDKQGDA